MHKNVNKEVIVNGKKISLETGIVDNTYISKEDLVQAFPKNIFYDKISRKLVITSWDNILKLKTGESSNVVQGNTILYDIDNISLHFGYKKINDSKQKQVQIYNWAETDAKLLKYRTEVYDINSVEVIGVGYNSDKLTLLLNDEAYDTNSKYVTLRVDDKYGNCYIGKIRREVLEYNLPSNTEKQQEVGNIVMTSVTKKLSNKTDLECVTALAVDMLRIGSEKKLLEESYELEANLTQDIYAVLNNGYKTTNFDNTILSSLVASDINKQEVSNQIVSYLLEHNLDGIVIDFKGYKSSDKQLIEQFIKELAAVLHSNNKKLIVRINKSSDYDLDNIKDFVDYIIIGAHSYRTTGSKISGSHSTIPEVKSIVEQVNKQVDSEKLILELATYSILWTEKQGVVINAEVYSMDTSEQYVKSNKLNVYLDKISGQNTINYTKGVITYKMWLEDEFSVKSKVKIAKDAGLAGYLIYKSGYENKTTYDILK